MSSRLSVCTLTRDEERNLGRLLDSVADLGAEVVVTDTGSTDGTVALALDRGAKVVAVTWDDDFSAGRNAALDVASGDWVLWLNPDEERVAPDAAALRALIDSAEGQPVAYFGAVVREVVQADRPELFSETTDVRLFRRAPGPRYVGRLHPALDLAGARPEAFRLSDLVIRRHSYMSNLDPGKVRWALRLLERELADRPGRLPTVLEYGRNLLLLNDPRGHEVLGQAVSALQPFVNASAPPGPEAAALLEYAINTPAPPYRGSIGPALAVALATKWFPESPPLLWTLAQFCVRAGQPHAAAGYLERLATMGETGRYDRGQPFDPMILGPLAWRALGQCRRALGDERGARLCFEALRHEPEFTAEAERLLAAVPAP